MPEDIMLQEAVEAIRQGQRSRARDLLTRLLRADASNLEYWLWMSSVVETPKEQIYCLQSILKLDPKNQAARQGLVLLGTMPSDSEIKPAALTRRKWQVDVQLVQEISGLRAVWANPYVRLVVLSLTAFAVILLIGMGVYYQGLRRKPVVAVIPTSTAGPSPTYTFTPTSINETARVPTAKPTSAGPPPLSARLEATYTPTPIYVNTPHAANEAYRIAQRAFERGDSSSALSYLRQARQVDPNAPDIPYFLGEIYRQRGEHNQALEAYQAALAIHPHFAPAVLGIALTKLSLNPKANVSKELQQAIQDDPNWGEAYLEWASYLLIQGEMQKALDVLDQASGLLADSPLLYLHRAQAELALGEYQLAFEDASKANQLDQTLLESYRLLAQTAAQFQDFNQALEAVNVYLAYEQADPVAWLIQGQALYGQAEYSQALVSLEKALKLDKNLPEARLYHGLVLMEQGEGQKAVNEIYQALQANPRSFDLNLHFARALLVSGRLGDALGQVNRSYDLAQNDAQIGQALFWRAQVYEAVGNMPAAIRDWKKLIALPTSSVLESLLQTAQAHVKITSTPAPTATRTPSLTPTLRPSRTPTLTPTLRPSRTPTPTRSPNPGAATTLSTQTTTLAASLTTAVPSTHAPSQTPTPK